jgi:phage gp36-like protein
MSTYYSTQATITARISLLRLAGFTDRNVDGVPDTDAMEAGFKEARGIIRGYIHDYCKGYGYDLSVWTDSTVPELIQAISDKLCIKLYYASNPRFQEIAKTIYDEAIGLLEQIRAGNLDIYEISSTATAESMTSVSATGRVASDFDPERDYDDLTVNPYWNLPDGREIDNS